MIELLTAQNIATIGFPVMAFYLVARVEKTLKENTKAINTLVNKIK